jgi:hypothetical protein
MPSKRLVDKFIAATLIVAFAVVAFIWVLVIGIRAWQSPRWRNRISGILFLLPNALLIASIIPYAACGRAGEDSPCFLVPVLSVIFVDFILPLPALLGTLLALRGFSRFGQQT